MTASWFDLSLDSFLCCLAIGTLALSSGEKLRLAMAFGACDALASFLGAILPHALPAPPTLPIYLVACLLLGLAARYSRTLLYALPVLLGIDNFFESAGPESVLAAGLGSAALALGGLTLGGLVRPSLAPRRRWSAPPR
jgi:hypothetical protein